MGKIIAVVSGKGGTGKTSFTACVALALFGGWIYGAALFGGYLWLGWRIGFSLYAGCWAVVTAAACLMLYLWLKKRGCALFASL